MTHQTLLLLGPDANAIQTPLIASVSSDLEATEKLASRTASFEDLESGAVDLTHVAAAWLAPPESMGTSEIYGVLDQLVERRLPCVLTRPNETRPAGSLFHEGAVVLPPDASPEVAAAILRTAIAQAAAAKALMIELEILRAEQGGLCGEFVKIDEEMRLAAQLQREFLPSELPSLGGIEARVLYRPACYVSGDIYDLQRLDEHHVGFFLADAVGHGVPAALMTVFIKRSLHLKELVEDGKSGYRLIPPGEAMARLNHDLVERQSGPIRFATACYGVIDTRSGLAQIARAGHPYPMLLRRDGTCELIECDGGLLGVFPEEEFEQAEIQLDRGDRILVYSDGFEVAFRDPDASIGDPTATRYNQALRDLASGTLDEAMGTLEAKLDGEAGSLHQMDDLTALLIGVERELGQQPDENVAAEAVDCAA